MEQTLVDALASARNALIAGVVWLVGAALWAAHWNSVWWQNPTLAASRPLQELLRYLGPVVVGLFGLAFAALFGSAVLKLGARLWLHWHRRVLTATFADITSLEALVTRLKQLTRPGRFMRAYSSSAVMRLYHYLAAETVPRNEQTMDARALATPRYLNAVLHHQLWSAPALLTNEGLRYAEQQKMRSHAELSFVLIGGMPLLLSGLLTHMNALPVLKWVLCVLVGWFLVWDSQTAWRDSNSQILHGVVEQGASAHLSVSWDVGKHKERGLHPWLARRLWSDQDARAHGLDAASETESR